MSTKYEDNHILKASQQGHDTNPHILTDTMLSIGGTTMKPKMTMVYWKSDKFWLGKLLEHPEIMTQGETLEELEENIKDAYLLMAMDDVPKIK